MATGRPGNWRCLKCGNENYGSRQFCNMRKCGARKDGSGSGENWTCLLCGNENFPSRTFCNRKTCGAPRETADAKSPPLPQPAAIPATPTWSYYYPYSYAAPTVVPTPTPTLLPNPTGAPSAWPYAYPYPYPYPHVPDPSSIVSNHNNPIGTRSHDVDNGLMEEREDMPQYSNNSSLPSGDISHPPDHMPAQALTTWPYAFPPIYPPPIDPSYYVTMLPVHDRKRVHSDYTQDADSREAKRLKAESRERQDGDWVCPKCGNINWPSRTKCNMKKCGAPKPVDVGNEIAEGENADENIGNPTEEGGNTNGNYSANGYGKGRNYGGDGNRDFNEEPHNYDDGYGAYDGNDANGYGEGYGYSNESEPQDGAEPVAATGTSPQQVEQPDTIAPSTVTTTSGSEEK